MPDFLLELRSEEIPARMQAGARADLERLFRKEMDAAGLAVGEVTVWSGPRRLALIARDLPTQTAPVREEIKGPRTGAPPQALEGFLRKTGLEAGQLRNRDGVLFAITEKPGRTAQAVLAEAIPALVRAFPWPKSQRWGAASVSTESPRWVRPLSGIVALLGDAVIACEAGGVRAGAATRGHRFHHHGEITIGSAADYREKLRSCHVIVDHAEREALIREQAAAAARAEGLELVVDEGLVAENAGLTEWPVPLLGRFDPGFLEVPPEVIQLTARINQKYFVCEQAGKLASAFVCTANIAAADGGAAIVTGNRKVLAARLSDARFFWEQDRRKTLEQHAAGLARITFHEKLGTLADKAERVARLARWLVEKGIVAPRTVEDIALADRAELAGRLCKADLVTEMVGEFPELQGLMGGYYARAEGLPDAVADAIRDHYKPAGQGDAIPDAPVTVAVALADKLDTLVGFFENNMPPTGSRDPFALRRAGLGVLALVQHSGLRLALTPLIREAGGNTCGDALLAFLIDRFKVQQREAGVRHDLIDAVFALGGEDDLVRLLARVRALQAFIGTGDGANLHAGYKRAANILKKEGFAGTAAPGPAGVRGGPAETALAAALDAAEPRAAAALAAEDFTAAMAALASLRGPIDAFFEAVMVNDPDPATRAFRLGLLERFRAAVCKVADFSQIEG